MMDGRVKTLHPRVHGGILARRGLDAAPGALPREHGIGLIDLVVVNLYPFAAAAANPATPFDGLIEEIDIGGPSLVRAAAKNFEDVLVVVSPARLRRGAGRARSARAGRRLAFRFELARKAFAHTGAYDTAIASTLADVIGGRRRVHARRQRAGVAGAADASALQQGARPALRREPAPAGGVVRGGAAHGARRRARCCRARSCRTRTCSISTRPRASCSSSTSRPRR